jgi:hypothetical protein
MTLIAMISELNYNQFVYSNVHVSGSFLISKMSPYSVAIRREKQGSFILLVSRIEKEYFHLSPSFQILSEFRDSVSASFSFHPEL